MSAKNLHSRFMALGDSDAIASDAIEELESKENEIQWLLEALRRIDETVRFQHAGAAGSCAIAGEIARTAMQLQREDSPEGK